MLPTKLRFIWPCSFRVKDFLEINQSETMLPTKFRFIWQSGSRGKDFLEIDQSETRIVHGGHVC